MLELIIIPLVATLLTQVLKLTTDGIPRNFNWRHMISDYGGMPSSHTAFVTSLATVVGLREGFNSAAFAIAFVLMLVVVRDAIGFRREIGKNAILTNAIAKEVFNNGKAPEYLHERIGHTLPQVIVGFILGCAITIILFYLFTL